MELNLERPLVAFDLETTGLSVSKDKIISISVIKIFTDGSTESKTRFVNPECQIPEIASKIHGITNEKVKDMPPFKVLSKGLFDFIKGCDLLSYNGDNYDIPLLSEEFIRCGITFPEEGVYSIDSCAIFKKTNPRNLSQALLVYCDEKLEDAHNSENDTIATKKVFEAQLLKHEEIKGKSVKEIAEFCRIDSRIDLAGKILLDEEGDYVYNIGDHKGKKIKNDLGFGRWMLSKDFTINTKNILTRIIKEIEDAK